MDAIELPYSSRALLAVGGELKNAFCLAHGRSAYMSAPNGDLAYLEAQARFEAALREMQAKLVITPEAIACDQHPGYHSTRWAEAAAQQMGIPLIRVQHHHAHVASVMAEHGMSADEPVIGIALDGTGYGSDGAVWGGEVLVADYRTFTRAAHLKYAPLPGGDAAVRKPYRMALAHLRAAGIPWDEDLPPVRACPPEERRVLLRQLERGLNTVPTSSAGRLFDAVASLLGVRQVIESEGQAAIELEACAAEVSTTPYELCIDVDESPIQIDPEPLLYALVADYRAGIDRALMSGWFHRALAQALTDTALVVRARTGINRVALSGGVFANRRLRRALNDGLKDCAFEVYTNRLVAANDSGLALGQAAVAHFSTGA